MVKIKLGLGLGLVPSPERVYYSSLHCYSLNLDLFETTPSLAGYIALDGWLEAFAIIVCFLIVFVVLSMTLPHFKIAKKVRNTKNLSSSTFAMQLMLYKAIGMQKIVVVVFLVVPLTLLVFFFLAGPALGSLYSLWVLNLFGFHTMVDSAVVVYYIKPYKLYVKELWKRFYNGLNKLAGRKVDTNLSQMFTVVPLASNFKNRTIRK